MVISSPFTLTTACVAGVSFLPQPPIKAIPTVAAIAKSLFIFIFWLSSEASSRPQLPMTFHGGRAQQRRTRRRQPAVRQRGRRGAVSVADGDPVAQSRFAARGHVDAPLGRAGRDLRVRLRLVEHGP